MMKELMYNNYEQKLKLHILFVDYKQAYDNKSQKKIIQKMEILRIPK